MREGYRACPNCRGAGRTRSWSGVWNCGRCDGRGEIPDEDVVAALQIRVERRERQIDRLRKAIEPFASPMTSIRTPRIAERPEDDEMVVGGTAGDWFRLILATGRVSAEYLRDLPGGPSPEFFATLEGDE